MTSTATLVALLLGAAQSTGTMSPTSRLDSNLVKATDSTTPRALRDRFADTTYAADEGVVADSTTAASANVTNLNAAIVKVIASGKRLLLPPGVIYVNAPIVVNTTTGAWIEGQGTTLRYTGASQSGQGTSVLAIGPTANAWSVQINKLSVDANSLVDYGVTVGRVGGSSTGTSVGLFVTKALVAGMRLLSPQGWKWDSFAAWANDGDGLLVEADASPTFEHFVGGGFASNGGSGVHIKRGGTMTFDKSLVQGNADYGVWIEGRGVIQTLSFKEPYIEGNLTADLCQVKAENPGATTIENVMFDRPHFSVSAGVVVFCVEYGNYYLNSPTPRNIGGTVGGGGVLLLKTTKTDADLATHWTVTAGATFLAYGLQSAYADAAGTVHLGAPPVTGPLFSMANTSGTNVTFEGVTRATAGDWVDYAASMSSALGHTGKMRFYREGGSGSNAQTNWLLFLSNGTTGALTERVHIRGQDGAIWDVTGAGSTVVTGMRVSADRGDADRTITVRVDEPIQRWDTTLTANRTVTCSTTGAENGDIFRVVRKGLGAYTLDVCGVKTIPSGTAATVDVVYDGSAWVLSSYTPN